MLIQILFYVLAAIAIFATGMTVTRRSPVASALWLVGAFFALAAIYTLLGAIMVLFLFVIMLLNLGNEYEPDFRGHIWKFVAGGSALILVALLARVAGSPATPRAPGDGPEAMAAQLAERGVVGVIGIPMYTDFVVHLQVAGMLLLVAVVGAVVLAKRRI